ncbi:hypothetical protein D9757_001950 [Collybiopsis confluens]|uniref:U4/U6.U5 small nuclear ribonucleoprotein 27kDa protein domain-containing protein n=1 Tax=Collybiopsis confluens TaxID=2823264 RepID=A0A8H5HXS0_9AGAR|nr:hypothetical protein D9757_001950 [Collybiopsis confluens]
MQNNEAEAVHHEKGAGKRRTEAAIDIPAREVAGVVTETNPEEDPAEVGVRADHRERHRDDRRERDSRKRDDEKDKEKDRPRETDREREREATKRAEPQDPGHPESNPNDNDAVDTETGPELDDEAAMMAAMGMSGFGTTKGKHVEGNQEGASNLKKTRTWRQYMNRRGGFNRPLDKIK